MILMPLFKTQPIQKVLNNCAKRHLIMEAKQLNEIQDKVLWLEKNPTLFDTLRNQLISQYKVVLHANADRGYSISSVYHKDNERQRAKIAIFISDVSMKKLCPRTIK